MNSTESTKGAYVEPKMMIFKIALQSPILDVSKPGGTVNPVDPNED